ncbi:MAG TPA: hypothetical protein VKV26_15720 [Dehalococcoidia bacterium]|nr:hypothetical protein [Dehalococcoidia bacterium]
MTWARLGREALLGLLALVCAAVVILPILWLTNLAYHAGLYALLIAICAAGVVLLAYQVRLRPALREPAFRAAAGIAEALRGPEVEAPQRSSDAAFRVWGGVPIALLHVSLHRPADGTPTALAETLCRYVRERAAHTATLNWALSEVGGERLLLLQEPEQTAAPIAPLRGTLASTCRLEQSFYHLWSVNGPASYEEPVAFATVLLAQAVSGHEPELHDLAVRMAERVAQLPDVAGVEVLQSEARGTEPPYFLWLAAGRSRAVRRRVYLALEPASAAQGIAWSIDRYDLLACDAYATLEGRAEGAGLRA